ncbi:hypothetical protein MKW92_026589, partial [Papaver armeniacum]
PGMSLGDEAKKSSKEHEIPFETFTEQGQNSIANKLNVLIEQFRKFMELQTNQKAECSTSDERSSGARPNAGGRINQTFVSEALRAFPMEWTNLEFVHFSPTME